MLFPELRFEPQNGKKFPNRFKAWQRVANDQILAVAEQGLLNSDSEVFVIGSCFANEIRATLEQAGVDVHPRIDPEVAPMVPDALKTPPAWGPWDERVHYQCYTPFSVEQELTHALDGPTYPDDAMFEGTVDEHPVWWEPYRRSLYARSPEDLLSLRNRMTRHIRDGIDKAELVIITLGLIEAHRLLDHPGYACEFNPHFRDRVAFADPGFAEAEAAMDRAVSLIRAGWPDKPIVLTVSPIPLRRTFRSEDVITATVRSKSILRAVADTIARKHTNIHYWPSYDYVMWRGNGFRDDDKRHVKSEMVREITDAFSRVYFSGRGFSGGKLIGKLLGALRS